MRDRADGRRGDPGRARENHDHGSADEDGVGSHGDRERPCEDLADLSIVWAVILIGAQAFLFARLGLRLGSRLNQAARESPEQSGGVALIALGVLILVETVA